MEYSELIINRQYEGFCPYNFGYEDCSPSHHFGPAVREHWLLHYVVSGFGRFERGGKIYNITPGQIFVIPPNVTTYYEADSSRPWSYIWIGFTSSGELPLNLPDIITAPELGTVFESMKYSSRLENGKEAYLSAKIWEMFSALLEHTKPHNDVIDIAVNYINNNFHKPITITDVAEIVGFERTYFSTAFKKRKGVSPQKYLHTLRMERAAALIISGIKPSVVAYSVGYNDIFVFSKTFKKHFGVSPRMFSRTVSGSEK